MTDSKFRQVAGLRRRHWTDRLPAEQKRIHLRVTQDEDRRDLTGRLMGDPPPGLADRRREVRWDEQEDCDG